MAIYRSHQEVDKEALTNAILGPDEMMESIKTNIYARAAQEVARQGVMSIEDNERRDVSIFKFELVIVSIDESENFIELLTDIDAVLGDPNASSEKIYNARQALKYIAQHIKYGQRKMVPQREEE